MGFTDSNNMVPLIVLGVLWRETDEEHPITLERLSKKFLEVYEPREGYSEKYVRKKVVKAINDLNAFFEMINDFVMPLTLRIATGRGTKSESTGYRCKAFYLTGRLFSNAEIHMLCDGVLFSPYVVRKDANTLFEKLKYLNSANYFNAYVFVKNSDIVNRTTNEEVFESIDVVATGIQRERKVSFRYRDGDKVYSVSPYYLTISIGQYYMVCNMDGKEGLSHFRLDRMHDVSVLCQEPGRAIHTLKNMDDPYFDLEKYMRQRPRMTTGELYIVNLLVDAECIESVEREFYIMSKQKVCGDKYRVRIRSTQVAMINWLINMSEYIQVEDDHNSGVINVMCKRANQILEQYPIISQYL